MKKILLICTTLYAFLASALEKLIHISLDHSHIQLHDFHVSSVIDARKNQWTIGTVHDIYSQERLNADLVGGAEAAFYNYLTQSFFANPNSTPIVLRIVHLKIYEKLQSGKDIGGVELKFYRLSEKGELGKVFKLSL